VASLQAQLRASKEDCAKKEQDVRREHSDALQQGAISRHLASIVVRMQRERESMHSGLAAATGEARDLLQQQQLVIDEMIAQAPPATVVESNGLLVCVRARGCACVCVCVWDWSARVSVECVLTSDCSCVQASQTVRWGETFAFGLGKSRSPADGPARASDDAMVFDGHTLVMCDGMHVWGDAVCARMHFASRC